MARVSRLSVSCDYAYFNKVYMQSEGTQGCFTPETKKTVLSQDPLDKLEKSIVQSIISLTDEIINLKDIVIKNLHNEKKNVKNLKTELPYLNQIIMIWLSMADRIMQSLVVFLRMYLTIIQRVRSYQSCRTLMYNWSQVIQRQAIELGSPLPKRRRPLLGLLTEKTVKRFQPIKKTLEVEQ